MEPCRRHGGGGGRGRGRRSSRLFECLFCDKTFHKSQALGGHQNAHKKDHRVAGGYWDPYVYGNGGNHPAAATTAARDPYACWAPADSGGCPAASTMPPPVAGTPHGVATAGLVFAGHGGGISRDAACSGWRDNRGWRPMMGCESDDVGASFFVAGRPPAEALASLTAYDASSSIN